MTYEEKYLSLLYGDKGTLENVEVRSQRDWDEYDCMMCAKKARKEMEGVK